MSSYYESALAGANGYSRTPAQFGVADNNVIAREQVDQKAAQAKERA